MYVLVGKVVVKVLLAAGPEVTIFEKVPAHVSIVAHEHSIHTNVKFTLVNE